MNPFEDEGGIGKARMPIRLRRYRDGQMPEPGRHVDCVVSSNDADSPDRPRLAWSDGSTWHQVASLDDVVAAIAKALAERPAAPVPEPVAAAPEQPTSAMQEMARDVLQIAEMYREVVAELAQLKRENADLSTRLARLEATALRDGDDVRARFLQGAA